MQKFEELLVAKDDDKKFDHQTLDGILGVLRAQEQAVGRAPDLRVAARIEADAIRNGFTEECMKRFGRVPTTDTWSQPDDGSAILLGRAQQAESEFINLPDAGARAEFYAAVLAWLNHLTRGWPDAKVYAKQERQRQRDRLGPWAS